MNRSTTKKITPRDQVRFFIGIFLLTILIIVLYNLDFSNYVLGWIAFSIAAYSVAGNDAIQTIGTFIESKKGEKLFWKIFVFAGLLIIVHLAGWFQHQREIHFHRLDSFPPPQKYNMVQLLAPVVVVILTRLKAPISTTFLILGLFGGGNIEKMLTKSFLGYGIAFVCALLLWGLHSYYFAKEYTEIQETDPKSEKFWSAFQWVSTSILWVAWLLQDTANIAVFIPRKLEIWEFGLAMLILSSALAYILYSEGGAIQEVVSEKSDLNSAKAATFVDLAYAGVLFFFQYLSKMPMSTTWVFLGLLAGREIILHIVTKRDKPYLETFRHVGKDVLLASLGITVSVSFYILSYIIYPTGKQEETFIQRYIIPFLKEIYLVAFD